MHRYGLLVFASLMIGLNGCGSSEVPDPLGSRVSVKGKVSLGGKPVTKGTVAFIPVEPGKGNETFGKLTASGEYEAMAYPGKYRVAIEPEGVRSATQIKATPVPNKYWKAELSGLEIDIPAGGKEGADFTLP